MVSYVGIEDFVNTLEAMAADGFHVPEVEEYLAHTRLRPQAIEPYLLYKPEHYTRNLVHKTPAFEILVICWDRGQKAPIHGHEGELCWARVEQGTLRFTNYQLVSEEPLRLEFVTAPIDGGPGHLDGPADIHAVENCLEFGVPAASLHVYARPYAACDIYDLERGVKQRVRLAYDTVHNVPVS